MQLLKLRVYHALHLFRGKVVQEQSESLIYKGENRKLC